MLRNAISTVAALLFFISPAVFAGERDFRFGRDDEIRQVRPAERVKVKVKRDKDGTYTWELSGEDAGEIIKVDKQLREHFGGR